MIKEENNPRIFLEEGQTIELARDTTGSGRDKYMINSVIGQGGSAVCYDVVRASDGKTGKLKEFYPVDIASSLLRLDNGQLVPGSGVESKYECEFPVDFPTRPFRKGI